MPPPDRPDYLHQTFVSLPLIVDDPLPITCDAPLIVHATLTDFYDRPLIRKGV